jgi:ATP-dependent Clp protease ATP-binding subunit ClpA
LIKPLTAESADPILTYIQDIPRICRMIQDDWHSTKAAASLKESTHSLQLHHDVSSRLGR